jgi:hypothetical protein
MDLETIISHYDKHHRMRKRRELEYFQQQPTVEEAVRRAVHSRDEWGKRYDHQHRIRRMAYFDAEKALLPLVSALQQCQCFADLYQCLEDTFASIEGLNELFIYDVALRIGAKLRLEPELIYLHRETRKGAKALLRLKGKPRTIAPRMLPAPLCELPAYELEDILCIYCQAFIDDDFDETSFGQDC